MLRRSIWEFSSRGSFRRSTTRITTQIPSYLSSRKQYSVASEQNAPQGSGSAGKPPDSGSSLPKIIIGGTALAAAVFAAYHLNQQLEEQRKVLQSAKVGLKDSADLSRNYKGPLEDKSLGPQSVMSSTQEKDDHRPDIPAQETIEAHSDFPNLDDLNEEEIQIQVKDKTELTPEEDIMPTQQREAPSSTQSGITSNDENITSRKSLEGKMDLKSTEVKPITEQHEPMEITPIHAVPNENEMNSTSSRQQTSTDLTEDTISIGVALPNSLLDEYYIRNKTEATTPTSSDKHEDGIDAIEDSGDAFISKDGKLVLDFLQAIHAAEKRQAELDAHIFAEEKRKLKEKYDKELKDARARELMYAEEAAILDKELNKERVKAAAALKSLQEELEEKLRMELEQKEAEAEIKMKAIQELAKAELVAALASEKSSHIEKMAEADLHINALCMAFYARSEEARQSHSIHKLALGALALEDALSKGLPIKKEIDVLHRYLEGVDKDPLLDLVLSSLPQDTWDNGSDTILKLKHEFDALKGTLRHFSLIPPGGGGILAHSLAHVASLLKVKESDESGDGIESLMNKVESFLAEGKLSEAADTLENGVKGTQAAQVIGDWLRRARNRAVTEQALTLLQAYATSIGLT